VTYKFGQLPQNEWQRMYDLAKMFLYCFNHWKLETPSVHARSSHTDDLKTYKENYTRFCTSRFYFRLSLSLTHKALHYHSSIIVYFWFISI
jgi:hypothetical protein